MIVWLYKCIYINIYIIVCVCIYIYYMGFPGGTSGKKNPPANAGDVRDAS